MPNRETYNNLIDFIISLEEVPELRKKPPELFRRILTDYFFSYEHEESKQVQNFFKKYQPPALLKKLDSLLNVSPGDVEGLIGGEMINSSLAGQVYFSPEYLKSFYSNHPPSFKSLPDEVKQELIDLVKGKNRMIADAFRKMITDKEAVKERTVLKLIALILRNICRKTGIPVNRLEQNAADAIASVFGECNKPFVASQSQLSMIQDDSRIKELVKKFFPIKKFQDIAEISVLFKEEADRFRKRTLRLQK